jgi:hypothetical protein
MLYCVFVAPYVGFPRFCELRVNIMQSFFLYSDRVYVLMVDDEWDGQVKISHD